jgi:hypothetical protein
VVWWSARGTAPRSLREHGITSAAIASGGAMSVSLWFVVQQVELPGGFLHALADSDREG